MANFAKSASTRWQDGANLALGAWLFASPWILGFTGSISAMWDALVFGAIIAVAALAALIDRHIWEEWADMVFGAWVAISPWVLGFATAAPAAQPATGTTAGAAAASSMAAGAPVWNFVIVGALIFVLAGWSLIGNRQRVSTSA